MRRVVRVRRWEVGLAVAVLLVVSMVSVSCTKTPGGVAPHPTEASVVTSATQSPPTATVRPTSTVVPPTIAPVSAIPATTPATAASTKVPTDTPEPAPTATPLPDGPLVHIGDTVYVVDLAVTPAERTQGLSGRPSMEADRGMLFVYDEDGPRTFWMPDMHFPLDMVWIRADCVVAGVTADVPNPPLDTPRDQLELYPSAGMVRFILELNAGQAAANGIKAGGVVEFGGEIAGEWGC